MDYPLISVIIPMYNSEKYIKDCLESVISQSYIELEIVVVNDGSSDNSLKICLEYASNYKNIRIVSQENKGQSVARNAGVKAASGQYIFFLDSDDVIHPETLSILQRNISNDKEIAICDYRVFNRKDEHKINKKRINCTCVEYAPVDYLKEIFILKRNTYAWGILLSRKLALACPFPPDMFFEDLATVYKFILEAKSIKYIPHKLIFYRITNTSIVSHMNEKKLLDYWKALDMMIINVCKQYPELQEYAVVIKCYACQQIIDYMEFITSKQLRTNITEYLEENTIRCFKMRGVDSFTLKLWLWNHLPNVYNCVLKVKKELK